MKKYTLLLFLFFAPHTAWALNVTLEWDAVSDADLGKYSLYQADRIGDKSGPWAFVRDVTPPARRTTVTVPDTGNFVWYVTASDKSGNETGPSNIVELRDRTPTATPENLDKVESDS